MQQGEQMKIRLPADLRAFVADQAARYGNSKNAEVIRAIRERMERMQPATGTSFPAHPVAGPNDTALAGGSVTQATEMPR